MWVFIFLFGLAVGSFLNVCIYRIPLPDVSIHSPRRSFCPKCNNPINPYDNIPVLSYLLLRGKCRHCKAKISAVYPCVELGTAVLFLLMFYHFGLTLEFLLALIFVTLLIPISVIDARHYIIPNVLIDTGLILGLVIVCTIAYQRGDVGYLLTRLTGTVIGVGITYLIGYIGETIFRKSAMGGGDINLMALNGLFLGAWKELVMVIAFSAVSGAIVGTVIVARRRDRQTTIPYGPFLAGAAVLVLLWGDRLWNMYLRFVGWY
jgi:leader peptidase (prepilin peptidase)/N-methyltransferase